ADGGMGGRSKTGGRSRSGADQGRLCQPAGHPYRSVSIRGPALPRVNTDVLIVGAGPVGLALAGDLGWRGISCTIIEKSMARSFSRKWIGSHCAREQSILLRVTDEPLLQQLG